MKRVFFDMDGTIADLYNDPNWLEDFTKRRKGVFARLKPMVDPIQVNDLIRQAKAKGHKFGVVTWLPKDSTADYRLASSFEKIEWIKKFFPELADNILTCEYGTKKRQVARANRNAIIFDDDVKVREDWKISKGKAYEPDQILEVLEGLTL